MQVIKTFSCGKYCSSFILEWLILDGCIPWSVILWIPPLPVSPRNSFHRWPVLFSDSCAQAQAARTIRNSPSTERPNAMHSISSQIRWTDSVGDCSIPSSQLNSHFSLCLASSQPARKTCSRKISRGMLVEVGLKINLWFLQAPGHCCGVGSHRSIAWK